MKSSDNKPIVGEDIAVRKTKEERLEECNQKVKQNKATKSQFTQFFVDNIRKYSYYHIDRSLYF